MATSLPANASKDNSDSVLDDPELALLTDLAGVIEKFNSLKSALGAAALYNIAEGLATAAQAGGTPDDLRTSIPVSGKSSAYTITTTDRSKLIRATGAGGFTLSFTAAATLGDGWYCFVRNDATGTVTLDPNGAETIDGVTTLSLDAGQSAMVFCNGSLLVTGGPWNINRLENMTAGSPTTTVDADNDELLIYDASDGRHKKVNPSALGVCADYIQIQDQKSDGTNGGSASFGAWTARDLNTKVTDTGGHASLSSNQVTLGGGTYEIEVWSAFYLTGGTRLRWRNVTDSTTEVSGMSADVGGANTNSGQFWVPLQGRFSIATQKSFELQYFANSATSTNGLGSDDAQSNGVEIYTDVILRKVA